MSDLAHRTVSTSEDDFARQMTEPGKPSLLGTAVMVAIALVVVLGIVFHFLPKY